MEIQSFLYGFCSTPMGSLIFIEWLELQTYDPHRSGQVDGVENVV
jgi:hypothetical protein